MLGTGYQELIAFARWLGIATDPGRSVKSQSRQIERVVLAYDWDEGGVGAFLKTKAALEEAFPGIEVLTLLDSLPGELEIPFSQPKEKAPFLPEIVADFIPPYDPRLFAKGGEKGQNKIPKGPLCGVKRDLNDFLRWDRLAFERGDRWWYRGQVRTMGPRHLRQLREIRERYAYRPEA
jgi:hypothetical protein